VQASFFKDFFLISALLGFLLFVISHPLFCESFVALIDLKKKDSLGAR
jgi:hypothetical protein